MQAHRASKESIELAAGWNDREVSIFVVRFRALLAARPVGRGAAVVDARTLPCQQVRAQVWAHTCAPQQTPRGNSASTTQEDPHLDLLTLTHSRLQQAVYSPMHLYAHEPQLFISYAVFCGTAGWAERR